MAEYEDVLPLEGMAAPLRARHELRQMFERWLPRSRQPRVILNPEGMVDELSLLDVSRHYRLEYAGGAEDVATAWDRSEERIADGGPDFGELVRLGWVFFDGGRWVMQSTPAGAHSDISYPSPSTQSFLEGLRKARFIPKEQAPSPDAEALVALIALEGWLDSQIPTRDPDWIAARLWERLCPRPAARAEEVDEASTPAQAMDPDAGEVDRAFLEWSTWCDVLRCSGRWDINWGTTQTQYCREAAHRVLQRQKLWRTWDDDAARYADVLEKTFAIPLDRLRFSRLPTKPAPRTLVARVDWLGMMEIEHLMMHRLGASTVSFALELLCSELEKTGSGPNVRHRAATFLSFAAAHPLAMQKLLYRVNVVPALLVDMLMDPLVVSLGARLIIEWRSGSGRDSDRIIRREAQTKAYAVEDALSLLAHQLKQGTLDLEECAGLVTWCYAGVRGRAVADSRRLVGRQLLGLLAKEVGEIQSEVLQHLIDQAAYENNVPRANFAAVLAGLECLQDAHSDASAIVDLYAKFARDLHLDWTDADSLSPELAARLVATALAQAPTKRDSLLVPFDSAKLLRETAGEEKLSVRTNIAKTLREHVRLLARAVAGWPKGDVPAEFGDPFLALVSRSTIEHAEKGRMGVLTDRYSPNRFLACEHGSPAKDLAAAWRRLDSSRQNVLLQSLAQSDDPVLLAELCQHLPSAAKAGIQGRLRQLKPEEASTLWTWTELQRRIESLLAAGEYGLAREHFDDAAEDIDRAPSQFRLALFNLSLQLLMKEKDWSSLDAAVIPSTLDVSATRQAHDHLTFYRATSQLLRPNGELAQARAALLGLAARPGAAPAYRENMFAIAIQQLLAPTLHPLVGTEKVAGEQLLAEINAAVSPDEKIAGNNLLANRALLLLALQRPEDAMKSIAARRAEAPGVDLDMVTVLAKIALGHRGEAMAILDAALTEFGPDDRLVALKNDLEAGAPTSSVTSAAVNVDPISSIRAALQQLSELPPSLVGEVLGPSGGGMRGYMVRQVSRAVASLQHMGAMLRDRKSPGNEARFENDLNTAVREVLGASLAVAKWDVGDQSLGGSTSNGNPGERDAVVRVAGQEICIYEALVCSGLNRSYIKQHFDKLLAYGVCDVYFHVTYSYAAEVKPILDYLRHMLESEVPAGLAFLGCESLGTPDYETSGYIATYRVDHREVAVVFLIADLHVPGQGSPPVAAPVAQSILTAGGQTA
ncbi:MULTISPECIES: hypothetical protein [Paraburkholderia]|uniref:hypothetical protein n=1 Tax=Paraburkholderia TaxID=1822464 RepID=UPI002AB6D501|nr:MULTISPECIES: hypothetical protein [Paraburkholderia]